MVKVDHISVPIRRAIRQIALLPHFSVETTEVRPDGTIRVCVIIKGLLASRDAAIGKASNGILAAEPITFIFPTDYPKIHPVIYLRDGFPPQRFHFTSQSNNLGHSPCLTAEPLSEFFHSQGLGALCGQLQQWLRKAARGQLVNAKDGWEPNPIHAPNFLVLEERVSPSFTKTKSQSPCHYYTAKIESRKGSTLQFSVSFGDRLDSSNVTNRRPETTAIHVPVKDKAPVFLDIINPQTDMSLVELFGLIEHLKIDRSAFETAIANVLMKLVGKVSPGNKSFYYLPIIFDVSRPFQVTGTRSSVERFYFCLEWPRQFGIDRLSNSPDDIPCKVGVAYGSSDPAILGRLSGLTKTRSFALGGTGSLGSTIGSSLNRSGWSCSYVADPDLCLPHNQARHAFYWDTEAYPRKNAVAKNSLTSQTGRPVMSQDVLDYCSNKNQPSDDFLIHTSASPIVLEGLIDKQPQRGTTRLIDAELHLGGQVGLVLCEGPSGNPSCLDMKMIAFAHMTKVPDVGQVMSNATEGFEHVSIGGGCGTTTMIMSDAQLKTTGGLLTQEILIWGEKFEEIKFITKGHGCLAAPISNGKGVLAKNFSSLPFTIIKCTNSRWTIRLSPDLIHQMNTQRALAGPLETGGYLIGHVNVRRQEITCVLSLGPPPDSKLTPTEFILGTEGAKSKIQTIFQTSGGYLLDVGTWHTHLSEAPPSPTDKALTQELSRTPDRSLPSVMLVNTPTKFHALLADPVAGDNI